jgi:hypothetical protein
MINTLVYVSLRAFETVIALKRSEIGSVSYYHFLLELTPNHSSKYDQAILKHPV